MAHINYKVVRYSNEHIHVVTRNTDTCYLSRNWSRCTAATHVFARCSSKSKDRSYYNGNDWVKAPRPV